LGSREVLWNVEVLRGLRAQEQCEQASDDRRGKGCARPPRPAALVGPTIGELGADINAEYATLVISLPVLLAPCIAPSRVRAAPEDAREPNDIAAEGGDAQVCRRCSCRAGSIRARGIRAGIGRWLIVAVERGDADDIVECGGVALRREGSSVGL